MLPEHLGTYLDQFAQLLCQPVNRWEGFDQPASSAAGQVRAQILFAGWLLAALAAHPEAAPEERQRAAAGLAAAVERVIQRRVWAGWATPLDQAGLVPDPVGTGNAAYSGTLATLLGLSAAVGSPLYTTDPLTLRWSADWRFSYTHEELVAALAAQMRADYAGAVPCDADSTSASAMALVLWGLRLFDDTCGADHAAAGERWLKTVEARLALKGPRLPGRGVLAAVYHLHRRRAALTSDPLEDAAALALMAPLAPELVRGLAQRHWPGAERPSSAEALVLAFSALLATGLAEPDRAAYFRDRAANRPGAENLVPRALLALVACGGLGVALVQ